MGLIPVGIGMIPDKAGFPSPVWKSRRFRLYPGVFFPKKKKDRKERKKGKLSHWNQDKDLLGRKQMKRWKEFLYSPDLDWVCDQ